MVDAHSLPECLEAVAWTCGTHHAVDLQVRLSQQHTQHQQTVCSGESARLHLGNGCAAHTSTICNSPAHVGAQFDQAGGVALPQGPAAAVAQPGPAAAVAPQGPAAAVAPQGPATAVAPQGPAAAVAQPGPSAALRTVWEPHSDEGGQQMINGEAGAAMCFHQQQQQRQQQPDDSRIGSSSQPIVMALAHRSQPHFGVQFHPESISTRFGCVLLSNFLTITAAHLCLKQPQRCVP